MFDLVRRFPLDDGQELIVQYQGEDWGWGAYIPGSSKPVSAATPFGAILMYLNPRGGVPPWARKVSDALLRELREAPRYGCDCCGYLTMLTPSHYHTCDVCYWEDDPDVDNSHPDAVSGPNHISLTEARANFAAFGACDDRARPYVRAPRLHESPVDSGLSRAKQTL